VGRTGSRSAERTPISTSQDLGVRLRQARELRQESKSLSAVAQAADISTAYLQKLEVGDVKQPSPHVLHALSRVLDIDYAELMRLAGYIVPNETAGRRRRRNELTHALSSEELSEDEADELAEYLIWYRSRKRQAS
jgi:HTH-type transcriptional regulator, competence development regulator